ncbi:ATP-dependent DNA helicase [Frankliniella fusca]|uniref:ATP-dependent DNA helicase n=1 Tax=Frankliniella fusca TaxID=407009 RepID=A0AAE1H8N4_9NEOP|nr:ATP-dependent DNA helicase [Frankliniella fusca]
MMIILQYKWDKYSGKIRRDDVQIINEYLRKDLEIGFSLSECLPDLNTEQLKFLHFIKLAVSKAIGMPGTGKSYLLKACVKYIIEELGRESVKILAPTGAAAKNVEGQTLHSFLLLGKKCHRFASSEYVKFLCRISEGTCEEKDVDIINKRSLNLIGQV